ncbi:rod shape-determining protein MreC [Coxiella burnetii]|uniref:rod shape-determining protein MreC n=1 Tax=Coxiella burnetii TaxID=777 RepID=UPI00030CA552|nr:rod shape-determining protein MreC [Coxiella burnetii]AML48636.1 rod shape-determining protein MreC [Coxiella burnetii]AML54613.1 rod shape-determining protein MreC [Coxiella burnetii]ATN68577.1 rod shape-determining protein MreC [Coxiella burnetii]ATN70503.1 rod shape-determining protein MreC [Coxiella burnetii]ATN72428.1 rod shape-determining protein MreC [Coxiella burnetii]
MNKLIFKRSSMPGLRTLIYMGLAIALIVLDQKALFFQKIRADLALVVLPLQYLVSVPIKTIHWIAINVTTQQELVADNARLRAHELLLESKLQKLLALERENAQLWTLLKSTAHVGGARVAVAQLLAVNLDPNLQQIIVDKGMRNHIYVGQPVLDAYGVVGQVIQAGLLTSKVMLISDPKSAVPVQDYRNGIRALALGMGSSGKLLLINVPDTSDIQKGDLFVSSGLGLRYPVGYPVGVVTELERDPTKRFATITLQPSAHLDQSQQVLMTWPNKASLAQDVHQELNLKEKE